MKTWKDTIRSTCEKAGKPVEDSIMFKNEDYIEKK